MKWNAVILQNYVSCMHCAQEVPWMNELTSSLVDSRPMTTVFLGHHSPFRCQGGTQNNMDEEFTTQPSGLNTESSQKPFFTATWLQADSYETKGLSGTLQPLKLISASHTQIVLSPEPETTCLPSGENATEVTNPLCPSNGPETIIPVSASHNRIVLSSEHETTCLPSGENATELTHHCALWMALRQSHLSQHPTPELMCQQSLRQLACHLVRMLQR